MAATSLSASCLCRQYPACAGPVCAPFPTAPSPRPELSLFRGLDRGGAARGPHLGRKAMKRACLTAGLALLVALVSVEARAQTGILRGKVLDDQGKGIEDAK